MTIPHVMFKLSLANFCQHRRLVQHVNNVSFFSPTPQGLVLICMIGSSDQQASALPSVVPFSNGPILFNQPSLAQSQHPSLKLSELISLFSQLVWPTFSILMHAQRINESNISHTSHPFYTLSPILRDVHNFVFRQPKVDVSEPFDLIILSNTKFSANILG